MTSNKDTISNALKTLKLKTNISEDCQNLVSATFESTVRFQTSEGIRTYDVDDLVKKLDLLDKLIDKFYPEEML